MDMDLKYIEIIIRRNSFKPKKSYLYKSPQHKRLRFLLSMLSLCSLSRWIAAYLIIDDLYEQKI